jgi:hypothetical protein
MGLSASGARPGLQEDLTSLIPSVHDRPGTNDKEGGNEYSYARNKSRRTE